MLNVYMPNRSLRSTAFTSLVPYRNRSIRLRKRGFGTSAAKLWIEPPRNIQKTDSTWNQQVITVATLLSYLRKQH